MASQDDAISRRFSIMKQQVQQGANRNQQESQDMLNRKFSQGGRLGSGSHIKQAQLAQTRAQEQQDQGLAQVEGMELGERQRLAEQEAARSFATSEREATQKFGAEQAILGRKFASDEAEKGRQFQGMEAEKQRGFSRQLFDIEQQFKNQQFQEGIRQFNDQYKMAFDMQEQTKEEMDRRFDLDNQAQNFNMNMANKVFNKKSLSDSLLGMFGADPRDPNFGRDPIMNFGEAAGFGGGGGNRTPFGF